MAKDVVRKGYDKIGERYLKDRDQFKSLPYLEKLNSLLKPDSLILDIGCGAGKPVAEYLMNQGHRVIGIDISKKQIELARKHIPQGEFEAKDMANLKEAQYEVDAVVSFYAIFHIPREKHEALFRKIYSFLPKGGYLLVTMGSSEWEGTEADFHGVEMFWSHFDAKKNRQLIEGVGFEILIDKIDRSGGEKHQVILAGKMVRVVAALLKKNGRVLLAKRSNGELKGLWEFPGGKVNRNEKPLAAIIREIKEELGVTIVPLKRVRTFSHAYPFGTINLLLVEAKIHPSKQRFKMKGSHSDFRWVDIKRTKLKLAPLDKKIVAYLKEAFPSP